MTGQACADCGSATRRFEAETVGVDHEDARTEVADLSGWRCGHCGEVVFDRDSAERYAAAGAALVEAARTRQARELRRIRTRLGLTQERAALLTGGGHNAFSRYERGESPPMPAVVNLFRLLDRHPELLAELVPQAAATNSPRRAVRRQKSVQGV